MPNHNREYCVSAWFDGPLDLNIGAFSYSSGCKVILGQAKLEELSLEYQAHQC